MLSWGPYQYLGLGLTGMGNSMLKLRRTAGRLNFNMALPMPLGPNPNIGIDMAPGSCLIQLRGSNQ